MSYIQFSEEGSFYLFMEQANWRHPFDKMRVHAAEYRVEFDGAINGVLRSHGSSLGGVWG